MIRSLHLQFKSEISKCFLASAARPVGLTDNDNDKPRNVLELQTDKFPYRREMP